MLPLAHFTRFLDALAPPAWQESYDNAGLQCGDPAQDITGVTIALDCTEAVVAEAIQRGHNLVVCHHPVVFKPLKSLTGRTEPERILLAAIRAGVAIYATHTNLDHVAHGVNAEFARRLGLRDPKILAPKADGALRQLVTFVPPAARELVLAALHEAGAGQIGQYAECSFRSEGLGRFRPSTAANPTIGQAGGAREEVAEERLEVVFPAPAQAAVLAALRRAHPYEEVAYYLTKLENEHPDVGAGMIGELPAALSSADFLAHLKTALHLPLIKHTDPPADGRPIRRVAICGGAGAFLIDAARGAGADAFVTGDLKYHEYFGADGRLLLCDVGHYESEVATGELLRVALQREFPTFAVQLTSVVTNPVRYFT
ncbi:MAG: Nif3-like dinuclear metal center hexameric protein [Hymenobacteraceae bacterium]|nr:Nif3-like dinuclear metal center hexameric protein [Hymenobacteraceae bacterium]